MAREVCDRIVFIDEGRIVEEGTPDEFFNQARSDRAKEFVDKIVQPAAGSDHPLPRAGGPDLLARGLRRRGPRRLEDQVALETDVTTR